MNRFKHSDPPSGGRSVISISLNHLRDRSNAFEKVLAWLVVLAVKLVLEHWFLRPLDLKLFLDLRSQGRLGIKLALEPRFQDRLGIKLALE